MKLKEINYQLHHQVGPVPLFNLNVLVPPVMVDDRLV